MNIREMTREDFEVLPYRKWDEVIIFDCLIILPMEEKHVSGYRCMDFVAVVEDEAKCLLAGCSDTLHIDGIGGFGQRVMPPAGWTIDCLPKSGLLRIRPASGKMTCGPVASSFEIFSVRRRR